MSWDSDWLDLQRRSFDLGHEFGAQLLEHGNAYFEFVSALHGANDEINSQGDKTANGIASLQSLLSASVASENRTSGLWNRPLAHWQRIADEWLASVADGSANEKRSELLRESQRLGHDYQQLSAHYAQVHRDIAMQAAEQLQRRLSDRDADAPLSGRAVYDLWIDCCEEQYARTIATEEYAQLQGQMINAALAIQQRQLAKGVEKTQEGPTRSGFDALQQRLQSVEAELDRLRRESKPRAASKRPRTRQRQTKQ
jgi:class III poly(R)-hydroxyalkanoic acid synthase PhaE subunit